MADRTHPAYAILDGRLHMQEQPGGNWIPLDDAQTAWMLALIAGLRPPAEPSEERATFHHPV